MDEKELLARLVESVGDVPQEVEGERAGDEAQAYQLVVPATEKTYMPFCQAGDLPPPVHEPRVQPPRKLQSPQAAQLGRMQAAPGASE